MYFAYRLPSELSVPIHTLMSEGLRTETAMPRDVGRCPGVVSDGAATKDVFGADH